jgi:leucyl-tRNA synthetase
MNERKNWKSCFIDGALQKRLGRKVFLAESGANFIPNRQVDVRKSLNGSRCDMSGSSKQWPVYNPQEIEPKWQQNWELSQLYRAIEGGNKPKFYCLDFFPYPSGDGLHVGHCRNYVPTDLISRYKRMRGFNVLHPMGWDAFGEPAEQYAVSHGVHPRVTTDLNTANFRRQLRMIGTSYDWSREIDSSRPEFYRWTQWFFLLLYRRGLAYRDTNFQWWCPVCQTTLSSHEVSGGVCWRGHSGVTRREIPAWYFRITAYADELISGLDEIDWPEAIKLQQRNWIGRSEGVEIQFPLADAGEQTGNSSEDSHSIAVFTTRPDTLFGVTFFVLAPEHPLVLEITTAEQRSSVEAYIAEAAGKSEIERMIETREKTGVFTGGYVFNPLSRQKIPVWIADYVLPGYGTGAVMGVPAHDQRDFEFARRYGLPVEVVIAPAPGNPPAGSDLQQAYLEQGWMANSGSFSGLTSGQGAEAIRLELERRHLGRSIVNYRMRDWLISRQRYWGTPIPIVYCQDCGEVPLEDKDLPVLLPEMEDFQPDGSGRSPLARLPDFVNTTCPRCGGPARRETDTMGGFADSSWYFLRFTSPHYDQGPFEPSAMNYWMPVDLYVGGAEHAVLHLLYARFWTKVMADAGLFSFREPFSKLMNQGQLLAPDGARMSKSRGNVITPDEMVARYGADALRVYELFMAPFEQDISWNPNGISGALRFLNRVWKLYEKTFAASTAFQGEDSELERLMHQAIQQVSERIESFRLNTMVSAIMEFVNAIYARQRAGTWRTVVYHQALETLLVLLSPAAPHITEEIWQITGHPGSVHEQPWPVWDRELTSHEMLQIPVQINGKVRDVMDVARSASAGEIREMALSRPRIQSFLQGQEIVRVFYVPAKILSVVTRPAAETIQQGDRLKDEV